MSCKVELVKDWGSNVQEYKLTGGNISVNIFNLGGIVKSIFVPDTNGAVEDIVLGHDSPHDYQKFYFGALIGRFANRIAQGKFELDGQSYQLAVNNGPNHLHGGVVGFDKKVWSAEIDNNQLKLSYKSEDGEENYPGNLNVNVTYEVTDNQELVIDYKATCDKPTIINLTNHAYFNLNGQHTGNIYTHKVELSSNEYTPKDSNSIPTGVISPVDGTLFDLRNGRQMTEQHLQSVSAEAYDHNFLVPGTAGVKRYVGKVEAGGRLMEVYTTQPGVQFYTGYYLDCNNGKGGVSYSKYAGLCLETQNYPDAPNKPNFPSSVLRPGEVYQHTTWYKFSSL